MKTEYIIIIFSVLAVLALLVQPKSGFTASEIYISNFPESAKLNEVSSFSVFINDSREGRNYTGQLFFNGVLGHTANMSGGKNSFYFSPPASGAGRVTVRVYDNENEFNGYGSKAEPWELFFTVNVSE